MNQRPCRLGSSFAEQRVQVREFLVPKAIVACSCHPPASSFAPRFSDRDLPPEVEYGFPGRYLRPPQPIVGEPASWATRRLACFRRPRSSTRRLGPSGGRGTSSRSLSKGFRISACARTGSLVTSAASSSTRRWIHARETEGGAGPPARELREVDPETLERAFDPGGAPHVRSLMS